MGLFSQPKRDPSTAARLVMIERKLDAVMQNLGIALPADDFQEVRMLAQGRRTIEAIALYRKQTGCGLAEAKAFVESLQ